MSQHKAMRERFDEQAQRLYGDERTAALAATLDRLAAAVATVAAFPIALDREPYPTGPHTEEASA